MFLDEPPQSADVERLHARDLESDGYVHNFTRVWSWRPDVFDDYLALRAATTSASSLTPRDIAVLVAATAAAREDSYCSLAWGAKLAALSSADAAADVLARGASDELDARENRLAEWARVVARDPGSTTQDDVDRLREAGLTEREVFEATAFIAWRMAFSTVNAALGALPDHAFAAAAPAAVRDVVTYGRPAQSAPA